MRVTRDALFLSIRRSLAINPKTMAASRLKGISFLERDLLSDFKFLQNKI